MLVLRWLKAEKLRWLEEKALLKLDCATDGKLGHPAAGGVDGLPLRLEFAASGHPPRCATFRGKSARGLIAEQAAGNATRSDHTKQEKYQSRGHSPKASLGYAI